MLSAAQCSLETLEGCLCTSPALQGDISVCVQGACNQTEQRKFATMLQAVCEDVPQPTRTAAIIRTAVVLAAVSLPFLVLRLVSRLTVAHQLWWDDWLSFLTAVFLIPMTVFQLRNATMGFGKHFWNIEPEHLVLIRKFYYASQLLYIVIQTTAKVSILFLYLRIFPDVKFRRNVKIFIFLVLIHTLGFLVATACQCLPVSAIWDLEKGGRCINLLAIIYAGAVASIIEDLIIILLPITELRTLTLSLRKKAFLLFIFALGSFAGVTSLVRLKFLIAFGNSLDVTWDNTDIIIWSLIEIYAALICGCLITIRPLLSKYTPSIFSGSSVREIFTEQEQQRQKEFQGEETDGGGGKFKRRLRSMKLSSIDMSNDFGVKIRMEGPQWFVDSDTDPTIDPSVMPITTEPALTKISPPIIEKDLGVFGFGLKRVRSDTSQSTMTLDGMQPQWQSDNESTHELTETYPIATSFFKDMQEHRF
ncbi:hypothetical protein BP5796_10090 [Coleophoma crateriformis]|uniref:Uncharacterized protein n=1 Tax=Coleophoma crateriformis TaxID=565419 RepID=A0A3D8QUN1_9HELO|nr:hypothetical protein BP5796_10090 [Coleophoma crateriformis]